VRNTERKTASVDEMLRSGKSEQKNIIKGVKRGTEKEREGKRAEKKGFI